jgi:hypothetical protein
LPLTSAPLLPASVVDLGTISWAFSGDSLAAQAFLPLISPRHNAALGADLGRLGVSDPATEAPVVDTSPDLKEQFFLPLLKEGGMLRLGFLQRVLQP